MSLPWQLEQYRPLLRLQANGLVIGPHLLCRYDASDVIQETLARAHKKLAQFRGSTDAELSAWLRAAMGNVLEEFVRHEQVFKCAIRLERHSAEVVASLPIRIDHLLNGHFDSPSAEMRRAELARQVAAAIEQLEPDQRDAIILREMNGMPIAEIAAKLNRTEKSVAGLLLRGRKRLRELLEQAYGDADEF